MVSISLYDVTVMSYVSYDVTYGNVVENMYQQYNFKTVDKGQHNITGDQNKKGNEEFSHSLKVWFVVNFFVLLSGA